MTKLKIVVLATVTVLLSLVTIASGQSSTQPDTDAAPAPEAPTAAFSIKPASSVTVGKRVELDASKSTTRDELPASYSWDLDGDGAFETTPSDEPHAAHAYDEPGDLTVSLRVSDGSGGVAEHSERLTVTPAPAPEGEGPEDEGANGSTGAEDPPAAAPAPEDAAAPEDPEPPADRAASGTAPAEDDSPAAPSDALAQVDPAKPVPGLQSVPSLASASAQDDDAEEGRPRAKAAATTNATIKDFEFAPKTINIAVGDTVKWTNDGPTVHTATASDGSFDTGNLDEGQSGSHTFEEAGTFAYVCSPHPFMKGSVVVGSGSGGGGAAGDDAAGSDSTDDAAASGTSGDDDLPTTGRDLVASMSGGALLLALGLVLFVLTRQRRSA